MKRDQTKKPWNKLFDLGKCAAMLYIIDPFSCVSEDNALLQSEDQKCSVTYKENNPDEKSTSGEKPSVYDLQEKPKVVVFSGHVKAQDNGGAVSVTGKREYEYNDLLVAQFNDSESPLEYITHLATENIDLKQRPVLAEQSGAQVYIEIHHDSVNKKDLESAKNGGKEGLQAYGGFSLHISPQWFYQEANILALDMRDCFVRAGLTPNRYHAEEDTGARMQVVEEGVYTRPGLYILRNARIPTIIVEAGSIVVPEEEAFMRKKETQETIVQCIDATLIRYFDKK